MSFESTFPDDDTQKAVREEVRSKTTSKEVPENEEITTIKLGFDHPEVQKAFKEAFTKYKNSLEYLKDR
jgi:Holliday junction resolvasome RuvABC DNA-binding subunit